MPSGNVTLLFTVDKLECPSMIVHSASLRLNLHAKHGYCIVIGSRNSQLIITYVSLSNITSVVWKVSSDVVCYKKML